MAARFVLALVPGFAACTLIDHRSLSECSNDSDCQGQGDAFAFSTCNADGICVAGAISTGGSGGGPGGAGGAGGGLAGGQGGTGGACKNSSECNDVPGGKGLCVKRACVVAYQTGTGCQRLRGTPNDNETDVFVGLLTPLSTNFGQLDGNSYDTAVSMALTNEYQQAAIPNRPNFVFLTCDETIDPSTTAKFLLNDVGVRAIIGPVLPASINAVEQDVLASSNKAVLMLPLNDDPAFEDSTTKQNQLWSCKPNRRRMESYWTAAVGQVLGQISTGTAGAHRIFYLYSDDPSSADFAADTESDGGLTFNGSMTVAQNRAAGRFADGHYGDDRVDTSVDYEAAAAKVFLDKNNAAYSPELIVIITSGSVAPIIEGVEAQWPKGAPRPHYLLAGRSVTLEDVAIKKTLNAPLAGRVFAVDELRDMTVLGELGIFQNNFASFGNNGAPREGSEYFYDCFWEYAYALYAGSGAGKIPFSQVTATQFAAGMTDLFPKSAKTTYEVGRPAEPQAFPAIASQQNSVHISGASSELDFSAGKASPAADGRLFCVGGNASTLAVLDTGVTFSGGKANGSIACPTE